MKWAGKDHVVVGVVKDMVMESPYKPTVPTIFHMEYGWVRLITVRIKPTMPVREALAKMETVFKKYNPGGPFEYQFTDETYAKKFSDEGHRQPGDTLCSSCYFYFLPGFIWAGEPIWRRTG